MGKQYDVIVCGAGASGTTAAIAAARIGAKVLLVERYGFLGGTNTNSLVSPLMTFHAGSEQVITGIPQEVVDRLVKCGGSPGHIKDPIGFCSTITPVDIELLKQVYFEMIAQEDIELCLHAYLTGAIIKEEAVLGVNCVGKSGQMDFMSKVVVDATGDADIAYYSGAEFYEGREIDGLSQPMTMIFIAGGVDLEKIKKYMSENPDDFVLDSNISREEIGKIPYTAVSGFFSLVKEAKKKGEFGLERDRVLFFEGVRKNEVIVNMTRVTKAKGTNTYDLTRAEVSAREQVELAIRFLRKYIPGFEESYIKTVGVQTGVRESRRILGKYTLTVQDVVEGRKHCSGVARGAFPIDLHDPSGKGMNFIKMDKGISYDIPFEVMIPEKIKGLIVTGRAISATHEALASARVSATAMALGQAAGTAAAIAVKNKQHPHQINVEELRGVLKSQGANIGN